MIQTLFGSTEKTAGLFERMKQAVSRTRENLSERIEEVVAFNKEIDRNTLDDLEATLIATDLGAPQRIKCSKTCASVRNASRSKMFKN